jgi:hypothetical protein
MGMGGLTTLSYEGMVQKLLCRPAIMKILAQALL